MTNSTAPDPWLVEALQAIRRIAALSGGEAYPALQDYLDRWQAEPGENPTMGDLLGDPEWDRQELRKDMIRLRAAIRNKIHGGDRVLTWHATYIRGEAERLGSAYPHEIYAEFADELAALQRDAVAAAQVWERQAHEGVIRQSLTRELHSASSVQAIYRLVDHNGAELERRGLLTDELRKVARTAKERAARHRWQKKRDEADVAEAGGNAKKAAKLRAEAGAMLAQDWPRAFPGEALPPS
jgi:hypothetical protein